MRGQKGNGDGRAAPVGDAPHTPPAPDSLLEEVRAAADAAAAHLRKVVETAVAEARLSVASLAGLAAAALAACAFLLLAWAGLLALCVWLAVAAGAPVWAALAGAVLANLAGVLACRAWLSRLLPGLGFARTRRLLGDAGGTWPYED